MRRRRYSTPEPPKRLRDGPEGWVYVLSNPSFSGVLKIGRTSGDVKARAAELHATGVPTPFSVEFALRVNDCATLERWAHRQLAGDRVAQGREFFRTRLPAIVDALHRGVDENGLTCDADHDPRGLLPDTRARWAREAFARAEADRKAKAEAAEANRRSGIERELEDAIVKARVPIEAIRLRAALVTVVVLLAAAIAVVIAAYQTGTRGWWIALLCIGLWWLLTKIVIRAVDLVLSTFWRSTKTRGERHIEQLRRAADEAITVGAKSLGGHIATPPPTVLPCTGCGVGLRVLSDRKGLVLCPKCGKRDYYDTRR